MNSIFYFLKRVKARNEEKRRSTMTTRLVRTQTIEFIQAKAEKVFLEMLYIELTLILFWTSTNRPKQFQFLGFCAGDGLDSERNYETSIDHFFGRWHVDFRAKRKEIFTVPTRSRLLKRFAVDYVSDLPA